MKISKSIMTTFLQDLEFFYNLPKEEKPYMVAMFMKYFNHAKYSDIGEELKIDDMNKYLRGIGCHNELNTPLGITSKDIINKHTLANLKIFKKETEFGILNTIMFDGYMIGQFGSDTRLDNNCKFLNTLNTNFYDYYDENKEERAYIGFDCTKPFLHYGHLKTLVNTIEYLKLDGRKLVILLGTTTALIGDPTGQDIKRPLLKNCEVDYNANKIMDQIDYFMHLYGVNVYYFATNNYLNFCSIEELKKFFDSFTVNKLIEANRMKKDGLTVSELIYPLLQAYDFYYLKKNFNCTLQLGGKDQEINMIYGKKMIKELLNENVEYKTFELI